MRVSSSGVDVVWRVSSVHNRVQLDTTVLYYKVALATTVRIVCSALSLSSVIYQALGKID